MRLTPPECVANFGGAVPSPWAYEQTANGVTAFTAKLNMDYNSSPDQPVNLNPDSRTTEPVTRLGRPLVITTAVAFGISSAFPVVAGSVKNTEAWPKWWGVLDVVIVIQSP